MIIAHLPAGFLLARALGTSPARRRAVFWAVIAGSALPDLDMFWFHLVDQRAVHHHNYWVHIPGFWAGVALVTLPLLRVLQPQWMAPALAFFAALFLHVLLDSFVGDIKWLWPVSDQFFHLVTVAARFDTWVWNFVLHPSFLVELGICAAALVAWRRI